MATSVYLSNPKVTINAVDLQDQCTSATVNYVLEQLETTAFGDTARKFGASTVTSLQNNTIEVELYQSYAATETEATIYGLVGIQTTIIVAPATGAASATNPTYTLTGCYLESHTPINASLGELSTVTLSFAGGTLVKAVA
ncbi:hypothetical protein UFOVP795_7 [uncultured Caudovirales phage]|uniref:Uncharacterized protein n=1 Tax=uncultured Caudovirales phage TaxID=2100421 RepID=A0A6J5P102_9CAUD|nr:hypothetical protein UFOVP795_7 [uncultured Caudovirales phage]